MKLRATTEIQSATLTKGDTDTLMELSCDRSDIASGGFLDNWDDGGVTTNNNNSPTPFKLYDYKLRIFTSKPCVIWSASVGNLRVAKLSPSGVDTAFSQRSMANGIIKKWSQTNEGGYWSVLSARPKGSGGRGPQLLNDATWKLQVRNIDPAVIPSGNCEYYAIIEFTIEYDATSTA